MMNRSRGRIGKSGAVLFALLGVMVLANPASGEDGAPVLERLSRLVSTLDLPSGFREANRHASPQYPDAFIQYEGADGEIVMAMLGFMSVESAREWLGESIQALRDPRHGLRMLGLGDGAYAHRTSNISKAHVVKDGWRLTVRVKKGTRPAAEANRLAEQLLRKMYARFTGARPPRSSMPSVGPSNGPPKITDVWYTPGDATYDDDLKLSVRFSDPENHPVTVRWWYPDGPTLQKREFQVPASTYNHTFVLPIKPDREDLVIEVFVVDDRGATVGKTKRIAVEAPYARLTASSGQVDIERRISRLRGRQTKNLYAGDVLHFGSDHAGGLGRSTADLEWPKWDVRGRLEFDPIRHGGDTAWQRITIGPDPSASGFTSSATFLFKLTIKMGIKQGLKFILRKAASVLGRNPLPGGANVGGLLDTTRGSAGGSGMIYVDLKSLIVIQSEDDGTIGFYTYEGRPELHTPDGRAVVVPAAHRTAVRTGGRIDPPTQFDPANGPEVPDWRGASAVPRVWADVEEMEILRDVVRPDGRGLLIRSHLRIRGRKGLPTEIYAFFADRNETFLEDRNQRYYNQRGEICTFVTVTPVYEDTEWKSLELFIPYSELHLPPGRHDLKVHLEIYDPAAGQDLHVASRRTVTVEVEGKLGEARVKNVRLVHNQVREGLKGVNVNFELEIDRRLNRKTTVSVDVQFQNGTQLRDFDGRYVDSQGNITANEDFVPGYEGARWAEAWIFIPYAQLHLKPGLHDLRLRLRVLDPPTGIPLAQSDWVTFRVTQN